LSIPSGPPVAGKPSPKGWIWNPKWEKWFPDSDRTGMCNTCGQTYFGLAAFDKHLSRDESGNYIHATHDDGVSNWWQDEKQRWHHGPRMSEEQKQQLGWAA
jgi:hypothetical protein